MRLKGLSAIFILALISALVLGCTPTVVEVVETVEVEKKDLNKEDGTDNNQ